MSGALIELLRNGTGPWPACGLLAALLALWSGPGAAAEYAIGECHGNYPACLADWKQERLEFLLGKDGYLNLAGLFWLKAGESTFGSARTNDLVFPATAPPEIGSFLLGDGSVRMLIAPGIDVRHGNRPVRQLTMSDDTMEAPTVVSHASLAWTVIRRNNRFAVRLRDFEHPALQSLPPIEYFPASDAHRVKASLEPYGEPRILRVDTVIAGLDYNPSSPGVVRFELHGQAFQLEAYDAGKELFFVFGDLTSGRETYPAGRFLYAKRPGPDGLLTLDFNTAHNPPCAFNDFATCPVASPQNRLRTRIAAGEKYDPAVHH